MFNYNTNQISRWLLPALCGFTLAYCSPVHADETTKSDQGNKPIFGPCVVKLEGNLATVKLPADYMFVPKEAAVKYLQRQGEKNPHTSGIIVPLTKDKKTGDFEVYTSYNDCGYIKDDDAGHLNADQLLDSLKEVCEKQNEERKETKVPPFYVGGWAEKPHYERNKHQVVWAVEIKDQDSPTAPVEGVNYNTRILGRRGTLSLNLVTAPNTLEESKKKAAELLDDTAFNTGETYADYVPGKDKAAEYGIAGLILGGGALAAAKLGVFGALWKWGLGVILILKKFVFVAVVAVAAFFKKMFGRKKKDSETLQG
ncbi:MAG TPA: DUF2167 domain-containing protein [Planktothrix sp.]|jgi:uncharacterized membrane-anchored protein